MMKTPNTATDRRHNSITTAKRTDGTHALCYNSVMIAVVRQEQPDSERLETVILPEFAELVPRHHANGLYDNTREARHHFQLAITHSNELNALALKINGYHKQQR